MLNISSPFSSFKLLKTVFNAVEGFGKKARSSLSQFIYAQSEGNYVTIFYLDDSTLSRKLIRLSLKQLEVQFKNHSQVKRCHRSYLINTEHIITIDGNARSLTIQLDKVPTSIPVSRSFSKADFY